MTEFESYFSQIYDGRIVACQKMKRQAERLLNAYAKPGEFHYDHDIASRHIDFIETFCKTPTGKIGTPLQLQLFQKARLQAIFGFVDDNDLRQYNEALIIEGRKNGKTTEAAAVEIDLALNDDEGAPEIYNIATKREQAMKGYNAVKNMRRQSPVLMKHLKLATGGIYIPLNMGWIKALASNTNSLDSLDAHAVILDELAAIRNRDIYDLMKQAMGARLQPLLFSISTNGFNRECIFDEQYDYASGVIDGRIIDPRFIAFIYELDSPAEWDQEHCWIKANPGLGTIKSLSFLRSMVQKAKDQPGFKRTVLVKDFNLKQTSTESWLTWEELNNEETFSIPFDYAIGGFDAADSVDLNAACALCARPGDDKLYLRFMFWIPEQVLLKQQKSGNRRERDDVPYQLWMEQGWLRTCPGNKCDKQIFLDWFIELREKEQLYTVFIGYDPWHIDDSLLARFKAEFGPNSMIPIRQGVISLSEPMKNLKADFEAHKIIYQNNPIAKWCFYNTVAKRDVNGNIQPVKTLDRRMRIDGSIATLCAYKVFEDKKNNYINLNEEA